MGDRHPLEARGKSLEEELTALGLEFLRLKLESMRVQGTAELDAARNAGARDEDARNAGARDEGASEVARGSATRVQRPMDVGVGVAEDVVEDVVEGWREEGAACQRQARTPFA